MSRHHHTLRGHHLSSFFVFFMNSQISSTSTLVKLRFCRKYFVTSSQWVPAISSHFEIVSLSCPVALATPRMLPFSGIIASVLHWSSVKELFPSPHTLFWSRPHHFLFKPFLYKSF